MAQIFSIIGRMYSNFVVIVRCNQNFDIIYCWQHKSLVVVAVYKFHLPESWALMDQDRVDFHKEQL